MQTVMGVGAPLSRNLVCEWGVTSAQTQSQSFREAA
jgi:hypothetical protein